MKAADPVAGSPAYSLASAAGGGRPVVSPDGGSWRTAADLLTAAWSAAADLPPGAAVPVAAGDALGTLTGLLAAQLAGRTPVLLDPRTDLRDVARVLDAVTRILAGAGVPAAHGLAVATSGSRGAPRTVVRTVASWRASLEPFGAVTGAAADDVAWVPGPLSSTLALWAVWHAVCTGVPVVASGPWASGRSRAAGQACTVLHAVPAVLADLPEPPGRGAALRRAVVAGAPLAPGVRRAAAAVGVQVVEYYGAAELSFVAVDTDGTGLRPFPGAQVRVRGGLIEVRSPYLALGYAEPTPAGPLLVHAGGWAGVGDRGTMREDGTLVVAGRDDGIDVAGHTVPAADVEHVLRSVPGVTEVVCVPGPHGRAGTRVVAVLAQAPPDLVAAMRAAARRELPPHARPVRYLAVPDLPRTPGGKPARDRIAALVREHGGRRRPS